MHRGEVNLGPGFVPYRRPGGEEDSEEPRQTFAADGCRIFEGRVSPERLVRCLTDVNERPAPAPWRPWWARLWRRVVRRWRGGSR